MGVKEALGLDDKYDEFNDPYALQDDCLSCRLLGSAAFMGMGGYTYISGMQQLRTRRKAIELSKSKYKYGSRQLGIVGLSATLFSLGLYRLVN